MRYRSRSKKNPNRRLKRCRKRLLSWSRMASVESVLPSSTKISSQVMPILVSSRRTPWQTAMRAAASLKTGTMIEISITFSGPGGRLWKNSATCLRFVHIFNLAFSDRKGLAVNGNRERITFDVVPLAFNVRERTSSRAEKPSSRTSTIGSE